MSPTALRIENMLWSSLEEAVAQVLALGKRVNRRML
jgi:hypothetical protein|tara:strand:- start:502 stop:609 length:108 start_codon:yes stop_codon:yes gene_type:complete